MILKRLFHREMSEADLLEAAGHLVANPPWPAETRTALTAAKLVDGRTAIEQWRDEFKQLIASVATEKTWLLQRQRLIDLRVAAASWVALFNVVGVEPRTTLWRSFVADRGEFAVNPESTWPWLLGKTSQFANLNNAIMHVVGKVAYGTTERLEQHLEIWRKLREHAVSKSVALDRGINDINSVDPDVGGRLMAIRNGQAHMTASNGLYAFLREFADRIATDAVSAGDIERRWEKLCKELNATLAPMQDRLPF